MLAEGAAQRAIAIIATPILSKAKSGQDGIECSASIHSSSIKKVICNNNAQCFGQTRNSFGSTWYR
jgi:hypothetical protein